MLSSPSRRYYHALSNRPGVFGGGAVIGTVDRLGSIIAVLHVHSGLWTTSYCLGLELVLQMRCTSSESYWFIQLPNCFTYSHPCLRIKFENA